jgi:hypothetical protein
MQKLKTFTFSVTLNIILIIVVLLGLAYILVQPDLSNFQGSSFTIDGELKPAADVKIGAITVEYNYDNPKINDQEYIIGSINITNEYEPALIYGINFEIEGDLTKENVEELKVLIDKEEIKDFEIIWKGESSIIINFKEPAQVDGLTKIELQTKVNGVKSGTYAKVHFINLSAEGENTRQRISNIGLLGGADPIPQSINF